MQVEEIKALLKEAMSINASMGKIAQPCFKCLWSERTPDCVDNDWHKHDDINTKLHNAIQMLDKGTV
jgi:hypothetical protein